MMKDVLIFTNIYFILKKLINFIVTLYYFRFFKMQNASPQQIQTALKLCDLLGLDDLTVSISILEQVGWSLQNAMNLMLDSVKNQPPKNEEPIQPHPQEQEQEQNSDSDDQNFEYEQKKEYNVEQDIKKKKQKFNEDYEQIKLNRTSTEPPLKMERSLSVDRHIIQDFTNHRHSYQAKLLRDSQIFYKKILEGDSPKLKKANRSISKNENNRSFVAYLNKNFRTYINFTFGTFQLNLARSYLDKKFLLVYIHSLQFEDNRSVRMILGHKQSAKFINKNFVSYGMFDNSDDYQILQKYVPLKSLPSFAIFKFNLKDQKEQFVGSYQILQKQPQNFLQWVAKNVGVSLTKKKIQKQEDKNTEIKEQERKNFKYTHTDVMQQQNLEYEQMQRIYKLKRQESKIKKQQIEAAEHSILKMRQKFINEPKFQNGKTIEVRFRLPFTGKSIQRIFQNESLVKEMFEYVGCFGRDQFQQRYAEFDLTQTFPKLSLKDKKQSKIKEIFEQSSHQNIIVKQL